MEKAYLDYFLREELGKNKLGVLRRTGFVPAVVYGKGKKTLSIKLDRSHLIKFMHTHHGGENMVIMLRVASDGKKKDSQEEKAVLIKNIQYEPVKDSILHIDFNEISLTEAIAVKVPIESKGESEGVKKEGGVLTHVLWELEIECLPTQIPEKIEIDITNMKIGDNIYVRDLSVPDGVKVLTDKEAIVFTLTAPKKEEIPVEVPQEVSAEPEVIKEKKEKEGTPEEEGTKKEKSEEKAPEKKEKAPEKK